jgi:hypothetical protein
MKTINKENNQIMINMIFLIILLSIKFKKDLFNKRKITLIIEDKDFNLN